MSISTRLACLFVSSLMSLTACSLCKLPPHDISRITGSVPHTATTSGVFLPQSQLSRTHRQHCRTHSQASSRIFVEIVLRIDEVHTCRLIWLHYSVQNWSSFRLNACAVVNHASRPHELNTTLCVLSSSRIVLQRFVVRRRTIRKKNRSLRDKGETVKDQATIHKFTPFP